MVRDFFVRIFAGLFRDKQQNTLIPDIIPHNVYEALDFDRCALGGSYALAQFEQAKWEPNDIDIVVAILEKESPEKFKEIVDKFVKQSGSEITKKFRSVAELSSDRVDSYGVGHGKFHESMIGTIEVKHREVSKPIQFVGFRVGKLKSFHEEVINTMEAPACMLYTMMNSKKLFTIGENYVRSKIFGIQDYVSGIRLGKYRTRGY